MYYLYATGNVHSAQLPYFFLGVLLLQLSMPVLGPAGFVGPRARGLALLSVVASVTAYGLGAQDAFIVGLPAALFITYENLCAYLLRKALSISECV